MVRLRDLPRARKDERRPDAAEFVSPSRGSTARQSGAACGDAWPTELATARANTAFALNDQLELAFRTSENPAALKDSESGRDSDVSGATALMRRRYSALVTTAPPSSVFPVQTQKSSM